MIHPGEVQGRPLLPSFLYLPSAVELPEGSLGLPWDPEAAATAGAFARDHGAKVPARLVSSAKSWLSYAGVDRRAPILPWQSPDEVPQRSPLDASAHYLEHLRANQVNNDAFDDCSALSLSLNRRRTLQLDTHS